MSLVRTYVIGARIALVIIDASSCKGTVTLITFAGIAIIDALRVTYKISSGRLRLHGKEAEP